MSARLLTHLRHVDLAVPDYDKQLDFYSGVWGLTRSPRTPASPSSPPKAPPSSTWPDCARPTTSASTSSPTAPPTPPTSTPSPSGSSPAACS
ncbi:VOC family protein [Streptomyces sp. 2112.3]|uniref:VOC family protein n=1 Tax=Streptomyces sp. 2112.3 TaxID=1881023 RepID=UPI003523281A